MQFFKLYLLAIGIICLSSCYHSRKINRLQARAIPDLVKDASATTHAPETMSAANRARENLDQAQSIGHSGSLCSNSPISGDPGFHGGTTNPEGSSIPHSEVPNAQSRSGADFSGSGGHVNPEGPNPAVVASPDKEKGLLSRIWSKIVGIPGSLKAALQRLVSGWKVTKYLVRAITRKPHDGAEIVRYETSRDTIGKYLALNARDLEVEPGKALDLKTLAKTLEEKFPLFSGEKDMLKEVLDYEEYLKNVKEYQLMVDGKDFSWIGPKKSWLSELPEEKLVANYKKSLPEIRESFEKLQGKKLTGQFQEEYDKAVDTISTSMPKSYSGIVKGHVAEHFADLFKEGGSKERIDLEKLASAREFQLKNKYLTKPEYLDLENVFQHLPPKLDMDAVVFRYAMVEGFDLLLEKIRPALKQVLQNKAQAEISEVVTKGLTPSTKEESLLSIASQDKEWRETAYMKFYATTTGPTEAFKRLKESPTRNEIIRHAVNKNLGSLKFLEPVEVNKLRQAPDLQTFKATLKSHAQKTPKEHSADLKTLENMSDEAGKSYQVNLPLLHELKRRGTIGDELMQAAKGNKKDFFKMLGEEKEFTAHVIKQFETDLNSHIEGLSPGAAQDMSEEAANRVAESQVKQIDQEAKSNYLTTDAFQKPNSFQFDKALKEYDPKLNKFNPKPTDKHTLAQSYIDTIINRQPLGSTRIVSKADIARNLADKIYRSEAILYQKIPEIGEYFESIIKSKGHITAPVHSDKPPSLQEPIRIASSTKPEPQIAA
ncbi:hypothetical protein PtA15_15A71 [Puccinia triticina]|uniref:Uncharacterized protein n=1 Tax=Puccinia triticina TaxID=208348 RepID=A0ABY7D2P7_9BASI|nr:uncharacterized protein PtA15_15A71 [Puccinia triticina]WAQ91681.1 hypothetical protein PtA15_15A71 [Puccinia triticina]